MSVPGPVLGPCEAWIDGEDVAACCAAEAETSEGSSIYDEVALEASMLLYEVSGRQFTGLCDALVRPCRQACSCWGPASLGLGPWYWASLAGIGGWMWRNECGDRCGCGSTSTVKLAGYPVREITEVKIDGVVLDPLDANGNPNYRLDRWRYLVRMDDPGPPVSRRAWPSCQNISLDDTEDGTFSIEYRYGLEPPDLGRRAAEQLACQLYFSCIGGDACQLPQGATRVTREGVTVERGITISWLDPTKPTGIVALDAFLAAYWAYGRRGRSPAVWSPDVDAYPRRMTS